MSNARKAGSEPPPLQNPKYLFTTGIGYRALVGQALSPAHPTLWESATSLQRKLNLAHWSAKLSCNPLSTGAPRGKQIQSEMAI
jgi:hypothetical protein